jgi:hypothetical protein
MVNAPMRKMMNRIVLFFFGRRILNKRGSGMEMMTRSLETLKTALVMR